FVLYISSLFIYWVIPWSNGILFPFVHYGAYQSRDRPSVSRLQSNLCGTLCCNSETKESKRTCKYSPSLPRPLNRRDHTPQSNRDSGVSPGRADLSKRGKRKTAVSRAVLLLTGSER